MILDDKQTAGVLAASVAMEPFAVPIPEAARILGRGRKPGGGRSSINADLARGKLEAVKDGRKTLVTMESIRRLHASRPRAVFSPLPQRKHSRS
jgi:hypothetical protein